MSKHVTAETLTENRQLLDEISEFLLVKETITGDELMAYVNADKTALPDRNSSTRTPSAYINLRRSRRR